MEKSVNQPQTKNVSKDLLLYEWYSHVGTFIEIRCDDASRALKSHIAMHRLLLDSGRINDIKKKLQVRIKKKKKKKRKKKGKEKESVTYGTALD